MNAMKNKIIPTQIVQQIKNQCNLPDIVSSYITLNRNFKAICPFHPEKSPSLHINSKKQYWHCFGCHRGGDVFSFVQQIEGVSFNQAVEKLAIIAGVPLPKSKRFQSLVNRRFERIKEQLPKLALCREALKDYEIIRYAELRNEWRSLLLKQDKDRWDYMQMDIIEHVKFDALDAFIRKNELMLDGIEQEVRNGKYL